MKTMPFKFNSTVIIFLILGLLLTLLTCVYANDLWFGSEARWNGTNFFLIFLYGTLALIFFGLAFGIGKYTAKPYALRSELPLSKVVTVGLLIIVGLTGF